MKRLTKAEREQVRQKFGGRCAYCGEELGKRWHADHLEAVRRRHELYRLMSAWGGEDGGSAA